MTDEKSPVPGTSKRQYVSSAENVARKEVTSTNCRGQISQILRYFVLARNVYHNRKTSDFLCT